MAREENEENKGRLSSGIRGTVEEKDGHRGGHRGDQGTMHPSRNWTTGLPKKHQERSSSQSSRGRRALAAVTLSRARLPGMHAARGQGQRNVRHFQSYIGGALFRILLVFGLISESHFPPLSLLSALVWCMVTWFGFSKQSLSCEGPR